MAVAVALIVIERPTPRGAALEVVMCYLDACVDDVDSDALTRRAVVDVVAIEVQQGLADPVEVPQYGGLVDALILVEGDNLIDLNVGYVGVCPLFSEEVLREPHRESLEGADVEGAVKELVALEASLALGEFLSEVLHVSGYIVSGQTATQDDDVFAFDAGGAVVVQQRNLPSEGGCKVKAAQQKCRENRSTHG